MSAKILSFTPRENTASEKREATLKKISEHNQARVIALKNKAATKRPRNLPTLPISDEVIEAVKSRAEIFDDQARFLRGQALSWVNDWRELFALMYIRAEEDDRWRPKTKEQLKRVEEFRKKCGFTDPMKEYIPQSYKFERLNKIYDEEMKEAERLAAEARERIAQRIEEEFGDERMAEAMRDNDPQGWTNELDWNEESLSHL